MRRTSAALVLLALLAAPLGAAEPRPLLVTVDDLPIAAGALHQDPAERSRITDGLLAALQRHAVKAVGLVIWSNVRDAGDRALLERWLAAGHELGNHSARHLNYTRTEAAAYIADVEAGRAPLAELLAEHARALRFFRYPYLNEGDSELKLDAMRDYLAKSAQRNLPVTIDDQDWSYEKPWVEARRAGDRPALAALGDDYQAALRIEVRHNEGLGDRLLGRVTPQILLLHANEVGAAQWDRLFTWLERTGHRFASADEVLADPVFSDSPRYVGTHGFGLFERLAALGRIDEAKAAVAALLQKQAEAWNRGDLEAFCSVYADDASFVSPTGLTHGRANVLARYRTRYPDKAAMGTLSLEVLELRAAQGTEITLLDDAVPSRVHAVSVVARWRLRYAGRPEASGLTLLVLHPDHGGWRIEQDASM